MKRSRCAELTIHSCLTFLFTTTSKDEPAGIHPGEVLSGLKANPSVGTNDDNRLGHQISVNDIGDSTELIVEEGEETFLAH